MGVYTRFKKNPDGLRQLVELLELAPTARRQKMIDVGMQEDADYTQQALQYVLTFEDILTLPDQELAEVLAHTPGRLTALAISRASDEIKKKFVMLAPPKVGIEIREQLEISGITPAQIWGGQVKMVESARKLEKRGLVKTKRLPQY